MKIIPSGNLPIAARRVVRASFLATYGVPLLELQEHARTLGIHSLPRKAEAGASEYRDWRSRQDQSIKNLLYGMGSSAFSPQLRTNSEASMNPVFLLADFVSADLVVFQNILQIHQ